MGDRVKGTDIIMGCGFIFSLNLISEGTISLCAHTSSYLSHPPIGWQALPCKSSLICRSEDNIHLTLLALSQPYYLPLQSEVLGPIVSEHHYQCPGRGIL